MPSARTPLQELEEGIRLAGGRRELGSLLAVSRQCVDKWVWSGRISYRAAPLLERLFPRRISRRRLRPDLFA